MPNEEQKKKLRKILEKISSPKEMAEFDAELSKTKGKKTDIGQLMMGGMMNGMAETMSQLLEDVKVDAPVKGKDYFTPEEVEEIAEKAKPKFGKDYMTAEHVNWFLSKVTPRKGEHYTDGADGKDGVDGKSIKGDDGAMPKHRFVNTMLQLELPDKTWGNFVDLKGEKGDIPKHEWKDGKLRFELPNGKWGKLIDLRGKDGNSSRWTSPGGWIGGGISKFNQLSDVTQSYAGQAGKAVIVNPAENGLTFGAGGGGGTWGSITGTLSAQTDLQSALDAKVPYTGATSDLAMGAHNITIGGGTANAPLNINAGSAQYTEIDYGTNNGFLAYNITNRNSGGSASTDIIAFNDVGNMINGTNNFIDMGVNSSTYNDANYTIGGANAGYLYTGGGDLTIGTATAGKVIKFHTAGTLAANERMRLTDTGLGIGTIIPVSKLHIGVAPTASANYGTVSIGSGAFDGSTAGKFVGSANGTSLAINEVTGYAGNLMDLQVNGVSKLAVSPLGVLTGSQFNASNFSSKALTSALLFQDAAWVGDFTGINTNDIVTISPSNKRTAGQQVVLGIRPVYNQASGTAANTDLLINRTETAVGSGTQLLIDAQVGGTSKFNVTNNGVINTSSTGNLAHVLASTSAGVTLSLQSGAGNIGLLAYSDNGTQKFTAYYYSGFYVLGQAYNTPIIKMDRTAGQAIYINSASNVGLGGTTAPVSKLHLGAAPTASASYGTISLGGGAFDGSTTGYFVGSASGTSLAVNEVTGYAGNLIDVQKAGATKFKVDSNGNGAFAGGISAAGSEIISYYSNPGAGDIGAFIHQAILSSGAGGNYPTRIFSAVPTYTIGADGGVHSVFSARPTYNFAGVQTGSVTDFFVNATETNLNGATHLFADFQIAGTSKFSIDNTGKLAGGANWSITNGGSITSVLSATVGYYVATNTNPGAGAGGGVYSYNKTITNTGNQNIISLTPTYNQSSGTAANTDLLINRTQTAVGSGAQLFINTQVGGVNKFNVDNTGKIGTNIASPTYDLDINNNNNGNCIAFITNTTNGTNAYAGMQIRSNNNASSSARSAFFRLYSDNLNIIAGVAGRAFFGTGNVPTFQINADAGSTAGSNRIIFSTTASNVERFAVTDTTIEAAVVILPVQAATASAPTYVKGGIYFDTTLNKLRVGGATAWETITSV